MSEDPLGRWKDPAGVYGSANREDVYGSGSMGESYADRAARERQQDRASEEERQRREREAGRKQPDPWGKVPPIPTGRTSSKNRRGSTTTTTQSGSNGGSLVGPLIVGGAAAAGGFFLWRRHRRRGKQVAPDASAPSSDWWSHTHSWRLASAVVLCVAILVIASRLDAPPAADASGVHGNWYQSPTWDYRVSWNDDWTAVPEDELVNWGDGHQDRLYLQQGTGWLGVWGGDLYGGSLAECIADQEQQLADVDGVYNLRLVNNFNTTSGGLGTLHTYRARYDDGTRRDRAQYSECRPMDGGDGMLIIERWGDEATILEAFDRGIVGGMLDTNPWQPRAVRWIGYLAAIMLAGAALSVFRTPGEATLGIIVSAVPVLAFAAIPPRTMLLPILGVMALMAAAGYASYRARLADERRPVAPELPVEMASDPPLSLPLQVTVDQGVPAEPIVDSSRPLPPQVTVGQIAPALEPAVAIDPKRPLPPQVTPVHREVAESTVAPVPQLSPSESIDATARPPAVEPVELDQHRPQLLPDPLAIRPADV